MTVETEIEDPRWRAAGLPGLAERAVAATLSHLGQRPDAFEVSLLGCGDTRIAALNGAFRDRARPTNVLSWPTADRRPTDPGAAPAPPDPDEPGLGDIAVAYDTCAAEAAAAGRSLPDHTLHLLVHGTLHLLGYDHVDDRSAERMERIEVEILATLGVSDPY